MKQNTAMTIFGWILTAIIAGMLSMSAFFKLAPLDEVVKGWEKSGYPASTRIPIGAAEVTSMVLFLIPQTRVLGAVLLTGYLGGAVATHARANESVLIPFLFGVAVWLALFFRDPKIRALLPIAWPETSSSEK